MFNTEDARILYCKDKNIIYSDNEKMEYPPVLCTKVSYGENRMIDKKIQTLINNDIDVIYSYPKK